MDGAGAFAAQRAWRALGRERRAAITARARAGLAADNVGDARVAAVWAATVWRTQYAEWIAAMIGVYALTVVVVLAAGLGLDGAVLWVAAAGLGALLIAVTRRGRWAATIGAPNLRVVVATSPAAEPEPTTIRSAPPSLLEIAPEGPPVAGIAEHRRDEPADQRGGQERDGRDLKKAGRG